MENISGFPTAILRSEFWFQDGNVVLIAGHSAFKVHRGQLERHSEVFRDMFSLPQPVEQVLYDGCSTVQLHDAPEDVWHLLIALYDGLYFPRAYSAEFSTLSAVLRLSSKYFIEHLRSICLARLSYDYPPDLTGWDHRECNAMDPLTGKYSPRDFCAHPIRVIRLARELGLDEYLPAALYDLSRYGPSKIMSGVISGLDEGNEGALRLDHADLCRTLIGRESAQRYLASFIDRELNGRQAAAACYYLADAHPTSSTPSVCATSFSYILLNILRAVGGIACGRDGDPLFTLLQALEMLTRTDFTDGVRICGLKICEVCKAEFRATVGKARQEVWESIPKWFGLMQLPSAQVEQV